MTLLPDSIATLAPGGRRSAWSRYALFPARSLIEFIFPLRLGRLAYFVRLVVVNICLSFVHASDSTIDPGYWWGSVVVLAIYGLFFILLPRLRDAGMSRWWLLVSLVPIANILLGIIFLFRPPESHSPEPVVKSMLRPNQSMSTAARHNLSEMFSAPCDGLSLSR